MGHNDDRIAGIAKIAFSRPSGRQRLAAAGFFGRIVGDAH
jgi:hypothetical protein